MQEQRTTDDAHMAEVNRLWRAVKRDYFAVVLEMAGFTELDDRRYQRLNSNWDALCALDINVAASLYHGIEKVHMSFSRHNSPNSPANHRMRVMTAVLGVVDRGRAANPDVEVETVGELYALGEEALQRDVERVINDSKEG